MKLYAVIVRGVYPTQCVNVFDREESAKRLSEHLNEVVAPETEVQETDSFFPAGMCNADRVWLGATEAYMLGYHHNTSGNNE